MRERTCSLNTDRLLLSSHVLFRLAQNIILDVRRTNLRFKLLLLLLLVLLNTLQAQGEHA